MNAVYIALFIVAAVLTVITLIQTRATSLLAWAVAAIDVALLLKALR